MTDGAGVCLLLGLAFGEETKPSVGRVIRSSFGHRCTHERVICGLEGPPGRGPRILLTPRLFLLFERVSSTGRPSSRDLSLPLGTSTLLLGAHLDPKRQLFQGLPRSPTDPTLTPSPAPAPAGLAAPLSFCSDLSFWGNILVLGFGNKTA